MKVEIVKKEKRFEPFEIKLTIEDRVELCNFRNSLRDYYDSFPQLFDLLNRRMGDNE